MTSVCEVEEGVEGWLSDYGRENGHAVGAGHGAEGNVSYYGEIEGVGD